MCPGNYFQGKVREQSSFVHLCRTRFTLAGSCRPAARDGRPGTEQDNIKSLLRLAGKVEIVIGFFGWRSQLCGRPSSVEDSGVHSPHGAIVVVCFCWHIICYLGERRYDGMVWQINDYQF